MKELRIIRDDNVESPREWDNLGTMCCFHRRYNLGDKDCGFSDPDNLLEFLKDKRIIRLPLFLLDHSGLWMRTGQFIEDPGGWDSGLVGFIFVTPEKIREEFKVKRISKKTRDRVISCLEAEVDTYSKYLEGDVYGFMVVEINEEGEEEIQDSCWGFYGHDPKENGMIAHLLPEDHHLCDNPVYQG